MSGHTPPGHPGATPRWISSRKSGVGTALSGESPVWFTLGEGIINEVYYPRIDCADTREISFLVADDAGFFADERCDAEHDVGTLAPGVPAYVLTNTGARRFRLTKTIFTDVRRPALVIRVRLERLGPSPRPLRLFVFAAPHLVNQGAHNDAWVDSFRSTPLLFARRAHVSMAVACSVGWRARSCGYIGASDGRDEIRQHGRLVHEYASAPDGNVGIVGELALGPDGGEAVVVIGFGDHPEAAGHTARATLLSDVGETQAEFVAGWRAYHASYPALPAPAANGWDVYRMSMAVLRIHESKRFHGGTIASLAIPWGGVHGDQDTGGYHLVWPRDLAHASIAAVAAGRLESARQALFYLICTQNPEGNWTQNMWVDGKPNWTARQLDQTATFVLTVAALHRHGGVGPVDAWPAVHQACDYLLRHGPVTSEDRWEENAGYTPYTLATAIAALAAAAELADERGEPDLGRKWLDTADAWNGSIERWLYVTDTPLAREVGVEGYYVRIAPPDTHRPDDLRHLIVPLKNHRPKERGHTEAWRITSPDALALVRYGLRAPDDPRIRNTVRVIDATLRFETRSGPAWRRFNHDGYGETEDGRPFLGAGVGRCWPVLTGERAHYELACGNRAEADRLFHAMAAQAWHGLLPEQIWNADDLPGCGLFNGEPTGSATPLVWAHAEFITLARSLRDGAVFDLPAAAAARYLGEPAVRAGR